jgi:hypothetical protein
VDAAWPVAAFVAASVSAREVINTDDQPSRVVFDANRHVLSLTSRPHPRKLSCREAPTRPICALREGPARDCRRFYWLEKGPAIFGVHRYELIFDVGP